jgi:hypothetical protein
MSYVLLATTVDLIDASMSPQRTRKLGGVVVEVRGWVTGINFYRIYAAAFGL